MKSTYKPLSNTHPVIAQEAYGWNPSEVLAISHEKIAWKCSNNHIYCIGDCGGAMETSKCPECKNPIGGSSHRLLDGNDVATEMDGATRPARSDTPNNCRVN